MPSFSYAGVTFSGQAVSGTAKASSRTALATRLCEEGVLLLDLTVVPSPTVFSRVAFRRRFTNNVTRYFRHLATLVGAGVPLSKALDGLSLRAQGASWQRVTRDLTETVKGGSSLSQALARHEQIFSGIAIPMIAAGEDSGNLAEILERVADHREKVESLTRKVRGAMVYPLVVSVVAIVVIWIMLAHVVPVFSQMFSTLGAELPRPTRLLLSISGFIRSSWLGIAGLTMLTLLGIQTTRLRPAWRLRYSYWALRLPLIGGVLGKIAIARVSRTISTLVENGVPLLPALQTAACTAGNAAIEQIFSQAGEAVKRGRPLSEPLSAVRDIPPLASQILSTGEETANLGRMFGKLADFYEAETDAAVAVITSVLEPALVVVMGVIVAGILIAMYLPMFEVLGQIGS